MAVKFASARIGENKRITGGKPGDQTGHEVEIQDWYIPSKQWYHLRCTDNTLALAIYEAMVMMAKSPLVGYNQNQRNMLYTELKAVDWDFSRMKKKVNTDCSAMVRAAMAIAGIFTKDFVTSNEVAAILATGLFVKSAADKFCKSSKYLRKGDILVTRTKGHTGVIVTDGPNAWEEGGGTMGDGQNPYKKPSAMSVQKIGSTGESVLWVQFEINDSGEQIAIDGEFGPNTEKAVRAFQKRYNLKVDGQVGMLTRAAMVSHSGAESTAGPVIPPEVEDEEGWVADFSEYDGDIDFETLLSITGKNRVKFIVLRTQGRSLDKWFDRNVAKLNALQARGFKNARYAVYSYSYSYTEAEGMLEAERMLTRCKNAGANPVAYYYDSEETEARNKVGMVTRKANTQAAAKGWLKVMKASVKEYCGFYSMDSRCVSWEKTVKLFDGCWTARWNTPDIAPNYKGYHMWQKGYKRNIKGFDRPYADCSILKKGLTVDTMLAIRA